MITGFFLQVIFLFFSFIVGLLPVYAFPTQISDAILVFWGYANAYSFLWPIATYVQVLGIAVFFEAVMLVYNLSLKIWHMLRG